MYCRFDQLEDGDVFECRDYNVWRISPTVFIKLKGKIYNISCSVNFVPDFKQNTLCEICNINTTRKLDRLSSLDIGQKFIFDGCPYKIVSKNKEERNVSCSYYDHKTLYTFKDDLTVQLDISGELA